MPLACAAIQSLDSDFISRELLLARMSEMRDVLLELNARVIRAEAASTKSSIAVEMLRMRRILVRSGNGYAVLPRTAGDQLLRDALRICSGHLSREFARERLPSSRNSYVGVARCIVRRL